MASLYVVPTPIGNLGDLTERARRVLSEVDFIAAEDTRVTIKLLNHLGLKKPLVSYFEYNSRMKGDVIGDRIANGENCALVTDAGTPAISDPGADLVALCTERGITVTALPGACAVTTALAVSGLPTGRFCFEGFLAMNKKSRRAHLDALRQETRTMVFYEAPHKLPATLADLTQTFGDRRVAVCRELTKLHEEVLRLTLTEACAHFAQTPPRGEFVLVVEGAPAQSDSMGTLDQAVEKAMAYMEQGVSARDAVRQAASHMGHARNAIYQELIRRIDEGE